MCVTRWKKGIIIDTAECPIITASKKDTLISKPRGTVELKMVRNKRDKHIQILNVKLPRQPGNINIVSVFV
jgi:hypothetical protein